MYLSGVVRVRHIIKDDQNYVCMVTTNKIYYGLVRDKYLTSTDVGGFQ